jgi:2-polyprenyl-3-methyl-5-hydroxy-6-metoxy-1,4-benzoquinol methylase
LDYEREYASSTYGVQIRKKFEEVIALPEEKSDNRQRVKWLEERLKEQPMSSPETRILDVGSGLGVFPYLMAQHGWKVTALEPNLDLTNHLQSLGCFRVCGGHLNSLDTTETFDLITLNKVLEHVADPVGMLVDVRKYLSPEGCLYLEVPDGEGALAVGQDREEFFIEHLHVFSLKSLETMLENAAYLAVASAVLREPSGKYTIRHISQKRVATF